MASLIVALCLLSELVGVVYLFVFIIVILWKRWRDLWFSLPVALLPFMVYTIVMLWLYPQAYGPDLKYAMFRASNLPLPAQFVTILFNSGSIHSDLYFLMGIIGLFLYPKDSLKKRFALFLILPLLAFTRTIGVGVLGWYYLIPLFPFYAVGLGLLIYELGNKLFYFCDHVFDQILYRISFHIPQVGQRIIKPANNLSLIILLVISPFLLSTSITHIRINDKTYDTGLESILANPAEAQAVVDYINSHSKPDDVVLISPSMGWAVKANAVDYHISLAYMGLSTKFFPDDVSHDRFRFNPAYTNARYIVIDNLWMNWGEENLPDLIKVRKFAESSSKPVFQTKDVIVYETNNAR